jgi:formiminotetrahydrofolate cyclodeaminase
MADATNTPAALDLARQPFGELLAAIAAKTPSPGGGAVASSTGAVGVALASMVVAYSVDRKSLAQHRPALVNAAAALQHARAAFLELAAADANAYAELNALMKLPATDSNRVAAWPGAVDRALGAPLEIARLAARTLDLLATLPAITNPHLRSDLAIAALLTDAAARSAWWNVVVNLPLVTDAPRRAAVEREGADLLARSRTLCADIERACAPEAAP